MDLLHGALIIEIIYVADSWCLPDVCSIKARLGGAGALGGSLLAAAG